MENVINKIEELKKEIEIAEKMSDKVKNYTLSAEFRSGLRELLKKSGSIKINAAYDILKNSKEYKKNIVKASTISDSTYSTYKPSIIGGFVREHAHEYIPIIEIDTLATMVVNQELSYLQNNYNTSPGASKGLYEVDYNITGLAGLKIAVTDVFPEEVIDFFVTDPSLVEQRLTLALFNQLHRNIILATYGPYASSFNTAPYAASVIQPNFVDVINLIKDDTEQNAAYEDNQLVPVDLAFVPVNHRNRLTVLKSTVGERLYKDITEATPLVVLDNNIVTSPYNNFVSVGRSKALKLFVSKGLTMYSERVVDANDDRNLVRVTVEMIAAPFVISNNNGFSHWQYGNINTIISAIRQP